jgi:hypothetical protein
MGWLRKTFKKIGKGIKKAFMKFGKFMGKIGILGQVAMMFILPGIGNALASGLGSALGLQGVTGMSSLVGSASAGTGLLGSGNALLQGAGKVLQFAGKVASMPGKIFSSVTKGVTSTLTEFTKFAGNKLNITNFDTAASTFFGGPDSVTGRIGTAIKSPFSDEAILKATESVANDPSKAQMEYFERGPGAVVEDVPFNRDLTSADIRLGSASLESRPALLSPTTPGQVVSSDAVDLTKDLIPDSAVSDPLTTEASKEGVFDRLASGAREALDEKREALSDPFTATKAALGAITANQQEQDFAAQQAALASGEVINLGQYQDPGAFQAYTMQNTVAPIQGFQAPPTYNAPLSAWGQQFMFDPFNPQMARGIS